MMMMMEEEEEENQQPKENEDGGEGRTKPIVFVCDVKNASWSLKYDYVMSDIQTVKPDEKKEKGGDKADDKVNSAITLKNLLHANNVLLQRNTICACFWFKSIDLSHALASVLFCQQTKGTFSQSHYYLALYRFKAIEKDDLDFQYVWLTLTLNIFLFTKGILTKRQ